MSDYKVLYYPKIEIENEQWLISNLLYWDKIYTIVPKNFDVPYKKPVSSQLYEEEILSPFYVHSRMRQITEISQDIIDYLSTPEAINIFSSGGKSRIYNDKMDKTLHEELIKIGRVHLDKMEMRVHEVLSKYGYIQKRDRNWMYVSEGFSNFYISILASNIARYEGFPIITDSPFCEQFSTKLQAGNIMSIFRRRDKERLSEGLLMELLIENIRLSPRTKLQDILKFKRKYITDLNAFRVEINSLIERIDFNQEPNAIKRDIKNLYNMGIKNEMNKIKKKLKENNIKYYLATLKYAIFGTAVSFPLVGSWAFPIGIGASVFFEKMNFRTDRENILTDNPYSYLYRLQKYKYL